MAKRRSDPSPDLDVRAAMAAWCWWLDDAYGEVVDGFRRRAKRLEAGEPLEVHGWELPREVRPRFRHYDRVRVEPDGTVTLVEADTSRRHPDEAPDG